MQLPPSSSGLELVNWYWRVVRLFVWERFGLNLSRSSCLNYLHRLGFAFKRPKKRLVKANESKREAFVAEYAALWHESGRAGGKVFFVDEAHFRADAELRGKWVLRGEPALVDSSSPRYGEKASYYSAVCLETGEVEWMTLEGNSNSGTSVAFLEQLRERHGGRLNVIWDNAPAHRGEALREYLRTPELYLRLVNLPGYSPDINADEAIWGWAREEATGNLCLGTREAVQERVGNFLAGLANRKDEVKRRCRTVLQSRAETLQRDSRPHSRPSGNAHPTLALVYDSGHSPVTYRSSPPLSRSSPRHRLHPQPHRCHRPWSRGWRQCSSAAYWLARWVGRVQACPAACWVAPRQGCSSTAANADCSVSIPVRPDPNRADPGWRAIDVTGWRTWCRERRPRPDIRTFGRRGCRPWNCRVP